MIDGDTATFGCTDYEDEPTITLKLGTTATITSVIILNRFTLCTDLVIPLCTDDVQCDEVL